MSQDFNSVSNRKARRAARNNRSRPVLVTASSQEEQADGAVETAAVPMSTTPVQELSPLVVPTPEPTTKNRRFAGFLPAFNGNARAEQPKAKEIDPAQARLARATRKVPAVTSKSVAVKDNKESAKPATETKTARTTSSSSAKTGSTTRPASPFKTRYIFGMVLYLLSANFIGIFETSLLQQYKLDSVLTQFNLFGGNIIVRTSTLTFLVTLVVILVVLARLDLIPRSLGAATGAQANKSGAARSTNSDGERGQPVSMRQGVKGEDDALYQQYRSTQRRQKK